MILYLFIGGDTMCFPVDRSTQGAFKAFFDQTGTAQSYGKKAKNPDENVKQQKFGEEVVPLHGFFTSNLYPIPHTVAIDQ